jgi:signal transduction histidine kinase
MGAVTIRRLGLGMSVAFLAVLGILDLVQHYHAEPVAAFALSAVRAVPLLFFRRWPLEAWLFELAAVLVTAIVTVPVSSGEPWPWAVSSTAALTGLGGLVATLGGRYLSTVMLSVVAGLGVLLTIWPGRGDWFSAVVTTVLCAVGMIAGDVLHARRRMAAALAEERQVSAAERQLRSVVEERARIARELHDVVAHHMSMITVQAETARFRHQGLPKAAVAEFTEIARVARASLSELRGLLTALRDDGADPHRTPQPTLADLPTLVDRIVASGTPVTMTMPPHTTDLPQVVQLAVYRIVQEGLSNVVRHASGAQTWVDIAHLNDVLRVEVTNDLPPDTPKPTPTNAGHGLSGLRERVTLLGGTFEITQPTNGWRIRAELPLGR